MRLASERRHGAQLTVCAGNIAARVALGSVLELAGELLLDKVRTGSTLSLELLLNVLHEKLGESGVSCGMLQGADSLGGILLAALVEPKRLDQRSGVDYGATRLLHHGKDVRKVVHGVDALRDGVVHAVAEGDVVEPDLEEGVGLTRQLGTRQPSDSHSTSRRSS